MSQSDITTLASLEHLMQGGRLQDALIAAQLPTFDMVDWPMTTDSTNEDCKRWAARGAVRALVLANQQEAGRGQSNRTWQSPTGNLYLSLLTPITRSLDGRLALEVALALMDLPILTTQAAAIKWPNDLYRYDPKAPEQAAKWGGILIEPVQSHNLLQGAIIGVGINLIPMQDQVQDRQVTDLASWLGTQIDPLTLAIQVTQALELALARFEDDCIDLPKRFMAWDMLVNQAIQITGTGATEYARACGISEDGGLVIATDDGLQTRYSGQVRLANL